MIDFSYDKENKQRILCKIGKRIKEIRTQNKITTGELADLCNLSESCIFITEKGKTMQVRSIPSFERTETPTLFFIFSHNLLSMRILFC